MKIVVLDGGILNPGDVDWGPLSALGELVIHDETAPTELAERARGAEVLLTNKTELRRGDMNAFSATRLVGLLATGYNNVDIDAFAGRGIPVCNVPAYGTDDVVQHVMALLLELCRHTQEHTESVRDGDWERARRWCYWQRTPICLTGMTLGVVGFGSIGRQVGRLANAFGMKVLATTRTPRNPPEWQPFAFAPLERVLAESDVITLHCPLTPETYQIINAERLKLIQPGTILLNTARGDLVDEAAVADALRSGRLGGLGTDVLSEEPPRPDNPLLHAPNTLITPHMAWATVRARQNIINLTAENIRRWLEGAPVNVVNRP